MSSRILCLASICVLLPGLLPIDLIADESEKIADLVPADLKDWTIEYYVRCVREGSTRVRIRSDGAAQGNGFRKPPMKVKLSADEVDTIFQNTRELFNRYRVLKEIQLIGDSDVDLFVSIQRPDSQSLKLHLDTSRLHRLGVSAFVPKAARILEQHGYNGFHLYKGDGPTTPHPKNRLLAVPQEWSLSVHDGFVPFPRENCLVIGGDAISLGFKKDSPKIAATLEDRDRQQALGRKLLHEFRWRADKGTRVMKLFCINFSTDAPLTLNCDRQTLIDAGVLEEFDAWVNDINRRFEAAGVEQPFRPPWRE